MKRRALAAAIALAGLSMAPSRPAWAQFANNNFQIEMVDGPIQSSARTVGMAGAFTAIAEGIDGLYFNPAAVANRPTYSLDRFDYDVDLGVSIPIFDLLGDFDLNGRAANNYQSFYGYNAGFAFQASLFGAGFDVVAKSYEITATDALGNPETLGLSTTDGRFTLGYGLARDQVVVGLGLRLAELQIRNGNQLLGGFSGTAGELGLLVRPEAWRLRLAATARSSVVVQGTVGTMQVPCDDASMQTLGGRMLPCQLVRPWELEFGAAVQLGGKPMNPRWITPGLRLQELRARVADARAARRERHNRELAMLPPPERSLEEGRFTWDDQLLRQQEDDFVEREMKEHDRQRQAWLRSMPRDYVLLSASLIVVGASQNAYGVESFVDQSTTPQRAGERPTFGVRVGMETEPIRDLVAVRAGSYLEPSRFEGVDPRMHLTAGFDVRFLRWDLFGLLSPFALRAGVVADFGFPHYYQYISVSLGTWH